MSLDIWAKDGKIVALYYKFQYFHKHVAGLGESNHFDEIPPKTVEKCYELFGVHELLFKMRGKQAYQETLARIPAEFHHNCHTLLQYSAQVGNT